MIRLLVAVLMLAGTVAAATAHDRGRNRAAVLAGPAYGHDPVQGVGCYWARRQVFCSRYCFWQPDGKRYCVERERQARREHVEMYLPPVGNVQAGHGRPMK